MAFEWDAGVRLVWIPLYNFIVQSAKPWLGSEYDSDIHERSWLFLMLIMC